VVQRFSVTPSKHIPLLFIITYSFANFEHIFCLQFANLGIGHVTAFYFGWLTNREGVGQILSTEVTTIYSESTGLFRAD